MFCTTACSSSIPHASLILDGINLCWTIPKTPPPAPQRSSVGDLGPKMPLAARRDPECHPSAARRRVGGGTAGGCGGQQARRRCGARASGRGFGRRILFGSAFRGGKRSTRDATSNSRSISCCMMMGKGPNSACSKSGKWRVSLPRRT